MTIFLIHFGDTINLTYRMESLSGAVGRVLGDGELNIRPGRGNYHGWTYDELRALGEGEHQIEPKPLARF